MVSMKYLKAALIEHNRQPYRPLREPSRDLLQRWTRISGIIYLVCLLIFPAVIFPTVKICNPGRPKRGGVSIDLLAILGSEVLDRRRFSIDLGVQIRDFLTGRPESDERMGFVLDGLRVGGGQAC